MPSWPGSAGSRETGHPSGKASRPNRDPNEPTAFLSSRARWKSSAQVTARKHRYSASREIDLLGEKAPVKLSGAADFFHDVRTDLD